MHIRATSGGATKVVQQTKNIGVEKFVKKNILFVKRCHHVVNANPDPDPDPDPGQKTVVNESVIREKRRVRLRKGAQVGSARLREGAQRGVVLLGGVVLLLV